MTPRTKSDNFNLLRLIAGVSCSLSMLSAQAVPAQQSAPTASKAIPQRSTATPATNPAQSEEESSVAQTKAGGDGIKIHGHWIMDLKNADGTVVDHRDFNNSLVTTGAEAQNGSSMLQALLAGTASMGGFAIALITGPATTTGIDASTFCAPPSGSTGTTAPFAPAGITCYGFVTGPTAQTNFGTLLPPVETGLTTTFPTTSVGIQLAGNYTVPAGMTAIAAVQTYVALCYATTGTAGAFETANIPPSQCNSTGILSFPSAAVNGGPFTSTTVPPLPLTVTPGQIIQVSVTLTFT